VFGTPATAVHVTSLLSHGVFSELFFPAFSLQTLQGKEELKDVFFVGKQRGLSKEHMKNIKYGCMW